MDNTLTTDAALFSFPADTSIEPIPEDKVFIVTWNFKRAFDVTKRKASYLIVAPTKVDAERIARDKVSRTFEIADHLVTIDNTRYIIDGSPAFGDGGIRYSVAINFVRDETN